MVPGDLVALSAPLRRPLHDVHARTVVALHVEVAGGERRRFSVVEVARDRERFQKHFRHDYGATDIQHHAAFELRNHRGECLEIAIRGFAIGDRGLGNASAVRPAGTAPAGSAAAGATAGRIVAPAFAAA